MRGKVSEPRANVRILIHPQGSVNWRTNNWWVQPIPTVSKDGSWVAVTYFGTTGFGIGEYFDVKVLSSCEELPLREGQIIPTSQIPEAEARVEITVLRIK